MNKWLNLLKTRSVVAQIVTFVCAVSTVFGLDLQINAETQAALVGGLHAIVAIGMRSITSKAIGK